MNVTNSQSINVSSADSATSINASKQTNTAGGKNFSDELNCISKTVGQDKQSTTNVEKTDSAPKKDDVDEAINGLNDAIGELNKRTQKSETEDVVLQNKKNNIEKRYEDFALIDNNMNIQETQDKLNLQAEANMNFNSNGQPFAEFVKQENTKTVLNLNAKDLEEEKAIMSTMEENVAIANKNMAMSKTKTVENEHGVQKVDKKSNLVVDTIVNYDKVVMDKSDVEFFANLVDNGFLNIRDVQGSEKSSRVSKVLADLLAKAMNDNKPVRIDFDNNISVIIKIDRAGKISADFLPSSQVAEAYLKENLPLLRQRFDDNNIDYNELNQRQRKQDNQENRKKERKDE